MNNVGKDPHVLDVDPREIIGSGVARRIDVSAFGGGGHEDGHDDRASGGLGADGRGPVLLQTRLGPGDRRGGRAGDRGGRCQHARARGRRIGRCRGDRNDRWGRHGRDDRRQPQDAGARRQRPADEQQGRGGEKRHAAAPAEPSGPTRRRPGEARGMRPVSAIAARAIDPASNGPTLASASSRRASARRRSNWSKSCHREVLPGAEAAGAKAGRGRQTKTCRARVRSRRS